MKQFKNILSALALLFPVFAFAQTPAIYDDYKIDNGVATAKGVSTVDSNNQYTLTLETFATGVTTSVNVGVPVDIVLVLDVSGSMSDNLTTYSYTARASQDYSLYGYGNNTYYYLHTDGQYYAVNRGYYRTGSGNNTIYHYVLYYSANNTEYYLSGGSVTTTLPSEPSGRYYNGMLENIDETIWTGVLYNRTTSTQTKMDALKSAVRTFVDVVNHDANYTKDGPRITPISNQISIVKYAMNRYYNDDEDDIEPGDHSYRYSNQLTNANYSEVVVGFTDVSTTAGANAVKGEGTAVGVDDLHAAGATASDYGMTKAWYLLNQDSIKNRESNKVVVLFTDGSPTYGSEFDTTVADNTIKIAKDIKDDFNATVFTIGVFDNETENIRNYMNWTSSNYPDAEDWTHPGTGSDQGYYQNASGADLTSIFTTIAHASGASEKTIPGETMLIDAVSTSFEVPSNFQASDVVVYTRDIKSDGTGWDEESRDDLTTVVLPTEGENAYNLNQLPPSDAEYMTDESKVGVYLKDGKLMIVGFNYSKPDSQGANGTTEHPYDGNWVGFRTEDTESCAGRELVVEFKIEAQDGVTGGDGTNTNDLASSGVYVPTYNPDGSFSGYVNVNNYPYPQTDLPINIVIQKNGLRRGESATIQIYRAPILKNEYDATTGKPKPNLDKSTGGGWQNFTKVILTNTSDTDFRPVTKTLLCLDPEYVYRLKEDDWSWGYELDTEDTDTSKQDHNPFVFNNSLKTDAVKHAEAVSVNIFGDNYQQKSYKASKVQSFDNTSEGGNTGGGTDGGSE